MIRFRTIEPDKAEKPEKAAAKPAASAQIVVAPDVPVVEPSPEPKDKGLTRKTPLRAKKPAPARLFGE